MQQGPRRRPDTTPGTSARMHTGDCKMGRAIPLEREHQLSADARSNHHTEEEEKHEPVEALQGAKRPSGARHCKALRPLRTI